MKQADVTTHIFDYKTPFLLNALRESEHKSKRQGTGSDFYKKTAFLADPNPGKIDVFSSLTDPFEAIYVKSYRQRSKLDVLTLIDGSNSMAIADKETLISQCEQSIRYSVAARNDNYHSYLISQKIQTVNDSSVLKEHFALTTPAARQTNRAEAFNDIERLLPTRRSLVFLLSDFHWNHEKLHQVLNSLAGHYLVPIVIWQSVEYDNFPLWRFVQIQDAETHEQRLVFITPKQKQLIQDSFSDRKLFLKQQFQAFDSRAFWLIDQFSAQSLSEFFHGH